MSKVKVSGQVSDVISSDIIDEVYSIGTNDAADWHSSEFYRQTILPLSIEVNSYTHEFNEAVNDYMRENSVLRKMKNSLNTNSRDSSKIGLTRGKYQNNKKATQQLISTMLKGHSLLKQVREILTGQSINTKFIIQVDEKFYQVKESQIDPNLILSKFGGDTVSNPFSLAYQIDLQMLKDCKILQEENEISNIDILQTIYSLKRPYLDEKSKTTHREYPNIFFDSKDAEIYELYAQQTGNIPELDLSEYTMLRKELGGGGGYATPFYKLGDIGSIQVKYFNLSKGQKNTTVNFARFSLLRDRLRQLNEILLLSNPLDMKQELISFFTEKEENISIKTQISREFNKAAQEAINQLFKDFA